MRVIEAMFKYRLCSNVNLNLENAKKIEKKFLVSDINVYENVPINCVC